MDINHIDNFTTQTVCEEGNTDHTQQTMTEPSVENIRELRTITLSPGSTFDDVSLVPENWIEVSVLV